MKIIALTIQMRRTSPKIFTPNISRWKKTLSQQLFSSSEIPTALTLLRKVLPCTIILVQDSFFQFNHLKANGPIISEHINFWSIPFQFKEYFSCELSPLEFTAPKKSHLTYFLKTLTPVSRWKIPHTGEKESLDRCG